MALKDLHLADLHLRARELDVPRYRMLTRQELIEALEGQEKGKEKAESRKGRDHEQEEPEEEVETEEVTGILDRMPQGYGFLRLAGLREAEGDVYVSASQIRRCELRPGDEVKGPARAPRRGERHRALVRVEAVNDHEPESDRSVFEDLTPKAPHRELLGEGKADLEEPLWFGQRVLVSAADGAQASERLQALAKELTKAKAELTVMLAGPATEEAKAWEKAAKGAEIIGAGEELQPRDRVRTAELAIGRAKRRVEGGADPVVIVDSLSALA